MDNEYENVLKQIIDINKKNRDANRHNMEMFSPSEAVWEYGVIRLDIGRGVGKTTFIKNNATSKDLIITFNRESQKTFGETPAKVIVSDVGEFLRALHYAEVFETIYVDEPVLSFRQLDIRDALKTFIYNYDQTIVILGKQNKYFIKDGI